MAENLVHLAERFLRLSGELDATRRAMLACLSNGLDHDEASAPAKLNGKDLSPCTHAAAPNQGQGRKRLRAHSSGQIDRSARGRAETVEGDGGAGRP